MAHSTYDRSIRMNDEGYPPEVLEKKLAKGDLHKGTFLNERFHFSHYLQMKILHDLKADPVLEIGPGEGVAAMYMATLGIQYHTMDSYEGCNPTILQSIADLDPAFYAGQYEAVCSFQCLEHMPYDLFAANVKKMAIMSRRYVLISLPFHCAGIKASISLAFGQMKRWERHISFYLPLNRENRKYRKEYMEEFPWAVHYWEIGRKGFPLAAVTRKIESAGLTILRRFHSDNPYHYFFVAEKH